MIRYRAATPADAEQLCALGRGVFTDTFGTLYRPEDLAAFLEQVYGPEGLPAQLGDPAYAIQLAEHGGRAVGFAKLGPVAFPGEWPSDTIELHQLYVLRAYHGGGVGPALMDWALAQARAQGGSRIVLSVYADNRRAQRFYARYGFGEIGRYAFMVGDQADDDRIWARDL